MASHSCSGTVARSKRLRCLRLRSFSHTHVFSSQMTGCLGQVFMSWCPAVFIRLRLWAPFALVSCLRKLNDNLDVVRLPLKGAHERLRWLAPRDETRQPLAIRLGQCQSRPVPVTLVGVDAADDDIVFE